MSIPPDASQLEARARHVRALVLDVDGVLTDGRIIFTPDGQEAKSFHVRDGLGIQLLKAAHCPVALLSGRECAAVTRRAAELGIEYVYQGIEDKVSAFESLLGELECPPEDVAYVGDDLPDIAIFEHVGLALAVADAAPEVRAAAHVVLRAGGGQGAVREACELILRAKGSWSV